LFAAMLRKLKLKQPENGMATTVEQAEVIAARIGFPVLMRPSFVLGGRAMVIVYNVEMLRKYMTEAVEVSASRPVLVDRYLENAVEVDVDCLSDGDTSVIGSIMEHVELAGIHSGDSACTIPAPTLTEEVKDEIRRCTLLMVKELKVCGLMNVQYAIKDGHVYVLEVNPRASRTVPFVSKAIGVALAKVASLAMAGFKLKDMGLTKEIIPKHFSVKEAVFPFARFPGVDVILTPEMKSTGEVMGIDTSGGMAFLKSQLAAGNPMPTQGNVFLSVRDEDKEALLPLARRLVELGFSIYATAGTSTLLRQNNIKSLALFRIADGRPNVIDLIEEKQVSWIVNTPTSGPTARIDEVKMRSHAVIRGIPITTTLHGFKAALTGIEAMRDARRMEVCSIQEFHRHAPKIKYPNLGGVAKAPRRKTA